MVDGAKFKEYVENSHLSAEAFARSVDLPLSIIEALSQPGIHRTTWGILNVMAKALRTQPASMLRNFDANPATNERALELCKQMGLDAHEAEVVCELEPLFLEAVLNARENASSVEEITDRMMIAAMIIATATETTRIESELGRPMFKKPD
jgi:hypothetical protein